MVDIVKIKTGGYQIQLNSESGSCLLKSEAFGSKTEAKGMLENVISNPVFERKTNHQGEFMVTLKTSSGKALGHSNTYSSEAGMENGIKNLMKTLKSL